MKKTIKTIALLALIILGYVMVTAGQGRESDLQRYFNKASVEYLKGDYRAAYKDLGSALSIDPKHKPSNELMKFVLKEVQRLGTEKKSPANAALVNKYLDSAKKLYLKGEYLGSMLFAGKAYFMAPNNEEALIYFSNSKSRLREYEQKRDTYYNIAAAAFLAGFLGLALLLSYVSVFMLRAFFPKKKVRRRVPEIIMPETNITE